MAIQPDKQRVIFSEMNVDIPAGTRAKAAYDLGYYFETGSKDTAVLVVTMILNFKFIDGTSTKTAGMKLVWTPDGKTAFMKNVREKIAATWGEKFRLTTTNATPAAKDAGVVFDIQTTEGMWVTSHSHWNVNVTAVEGFTTSWVRGCGGWISNGVVQLDSDDFDPVNKGGPQKQRGAIHEFGHMLGYRDEYASANDNTFYSADKGSVMNSSETIQPRHYVFFADWISRQWNTEHPKFCKINDWKVNGTIDITNAMI